MSRSKIWGFTALVVVSGWMGVWVFTQRAVAPATELASATLTEVAAGLGATPMQTALAWLLHRAPNILLIPGTSSLAHLAENLAAADLALPPEALAALDGLDAAQGDGTPEPAS